MESNQGSVNERVTPRIRYFTLVKAVALALVLFVLGILSGAVSAEPPRIAGISVADGYNEDYTVTLTVEVENADGNRYYDSYCLVSEQPVKPSAKDSRWVKVVDGRASFDVGSGSYYIYAKDALGNVSDMDEQSVRVAEIVAVTVPREISYLPFEGRVQLAAEVTTVGDASTDVNWSSSDESVATVDETGLVTAMSANGRATITATAENGMQDESEVLVTDCIILPSNHYKKFIPNDYYTEEEAELMDKILFSRVADAGGYGTRGAVIAAARFITLEMPYMIPYFYENGRMDPHPGRPLCDGEGRYYHLGLYLSDAKYDEIKVTVAGPAHWGAPLTNFQEEGYFTAGGRYPNGLSCSGFVCWALLNGGLDFGDVGAGNYAHIDTDLSDVGENLPLTVELLRSGDVKVGDLIGKDGHIALIVGLDDERIWIAESYFRGVQTVEFTIDRGYNGVIDSDEYHYVISLEDYYSGEGVYTETWKLDYTPDYTTWTYYP